MAPARRGAPLPADPRGSFSLPDPEPWQPVRRGLAVLAAGLSLILVVWQVGLPPLPLVGPLLQAGPWGPGPALELKAVAGVRLLGLLLVAYGSVMLCQMPRGAGGAVWKAVLWFVLVSGAALPLAFQEPRWPGFLLVVVQWQVPCLCLCMLCRGAAAYWGDRRLGRHFPVYWGAS